ncbi:MAG TPA: Hsp20/alpha crystallin family protein [Pyrinomonadaceae bacterium]|nr:Hsp20/alpha crystallin family protein [Pyrinomonadaceae bacterium]
MNEKKESLELARKSPEAANPYGMMRRFTRDMERLFEDFDGFGFRFPSETWPFRTEFGEMDWLLQVEVIQNNGQFMVRADLPGMTKDDIKVEFIGDMLTISGERKEEKEEKREGFYRSERSYGNFYRQLPLPEGAMTEKAEATFTNGVLEVTMPAPKVEPATRKLEVKDAPSEKSQVKAAA